MTTKLRNIAVIVETKKKSLMKKQNKVTQSIKKYPQ
jgi:hypothetical protein